MSLPFAFLVAVVFFVATPSLVSIGARAQTLATEEQCAMACDAANRTDDSAIRAFVLDGILLCDCVCNEDGEGILHIAVDNECNVCIELLTDDPSNCPCDDTDNNGNTPLHLAASMCDSARTNDTINAGCNLNAQNIAGETPLCLVSSRMEGSECGGTLLTLLDDGADPCITDNNGMTACDKCGFPGTCDVLYKEPETCDCVTPPL